MTRLFLLGLVALAATSSQVTVGTFNLAPQADNRSQSVTDLWARLYASTAVALPRR